MYTTEINASDVKTTAELSSFELETQLHTWEDLTPHDVVSADGRNEIIPDNGCFIFAKKDSKKDSKAFRDLGNTEESTPK